MFKDRLAAALRESGLTQNELAARVGVSKGSVSAWLRGSEPRATLYDRLAEVLPSLRERANDREAAAS